MSVPPAARWISGYRGSYKLTPDGRVFSFKRAFPRELALHPQQDGLMQVILWRHGARVHYGLAELVLRMFGPRRKPFQVPRYRDGNRGHCGIDNLRWGRPCVRTALVPVLTAVAVRRIFRSRTPTAKLAVRYGVSARTIQRIKDGTRHAKTTRWLRHAVNARRRKRLSA